MSTNQNWKKPPTPTLLAEESQPPLIECTASLPRKIPLPGDYRLAQVKTKLNRKTYMNDEFLLFELNHQVHFIHRHGARLPTAPSLLLSPADWDCNDANAKFSESAEGPSSRRKWRKRGKTGLEQHLIIIRGALLSLHILKSSFDLNSTCVQQQQCPLKPIKWMEAASRFL